MSAPRRRKPRFRFPWREGNAFRLLADGDAFFPAMLGAIAEAREEVLLETYLVESGRLMDHFIDLLAAAARRGVAVRVLLDDYGARGLAAADRDRLQAAGVQLLFYNRLRYGAWRNNLYRDHRKLLMVDRRVAFVGGAGLTDDFDPRVAGPAFWRDIMLEIRGPVLADWRVLFAEVWQATGGHFPGPGDTPAAAGSVTGRVVHSAHGRCQEINRSVIAALRRARHRIWITTPYFVTSHKLRRLLRRAARHGLDVRLLLPGPYSDHPWVTHAARARYGRLLRHGVRIFEFAAGFSHAKAILVDDWTSIGSSNLDRWNQHFNLDANQETRSPEFAREVAAWFEARFRDGTELDWVQWRRRPWRQRLREWFFNLVVLWLDRMFGHGSEDRRRRTEDR